MSILHGGVGLPTLAQPVYNYIVHGSYSHTNLPLSEVPESTLKFVLQKVVDCTVVMGVTTVYSCLGSYGRK